MVRIVGMGILLGPRAPEPQDHPEVVFEESVASSGAGAAEVNLGPVLESRRLYEGGASSPGRLPAHPALDVLFAEDGVPDAPIGGRSDVAAILNQKS